MSRSPGRRAGRAPRGRAGPRRPWYGAGLRFECQPECGACCTSRDGRDYVYLEPEDVWRLALFLGLATAELRRRHTVRDRGWTALRMAGGACPFLDGWRCRVHPARPSQCRTFPFWPEWLRSREAWRALGDLCPGAGRGRLWSPADIRARRRGEEAPARGGDGAPPPRRAPDRPSG
ncbi:MAG TPA: YkgJ family cysteine cluster protein [Anaeromyxobacteraceae bacterium]|nr:YkgJ family cysteine cluster protein [Anaeromyxobacteraceae bacterium]